MNINQIAGYIGLVVVIFIILLATYLTVGIHPVYMKIRGEFEMWRLKFRLYGHHLRNVWYIAGLPSGQGPDPIRAPLLAELSHIGWFIRIMVLEFWSILMFHLMCNIVGHRWEDHSVATSEYGCFDVTCQRCGYSYHKALY